MAKITAHVCDDGYISTVPVRDCSKMCFLRGAADFEEEQDLLTEVNEDYEKDHAEEIERRKSYWAEWPKITDPPSIWEAHREKWKDYKAALPRKERERRRALTHKRLKETFIGEIVEE